MSGGIPSTKELLRELHAQGWRVERSSNGHYHAFAPDGKGRGNFAHTGEPRAMKNTLAELRRTGQFQWPPPDRRAATSQPAPAPGPAPKLVPVKPARDLDALFKDLKDAKAELTVVEARHQDMETAVRKAEAALAEAKEAERRSKEEIDLARRLVMEAKAEFDEAFEAGEAKAS